MMVGGLLLALSLAPLVALVGCLVMRRPRVCEGVQPGRQRDRPSPARCRSRSWSTDGRCCSGTTTSSSIGPRPGSILCTAIVYFLASIYAVGYMRLLSEDDRLLRFYALVRRFRPDDADRAR